METTTRQIEIQIDVRNDERQHVREYFPGDDEGRWLGALTRTEIDALITRYRGHFRIPVVVVEIAAAKAAAA